MNVDKLLKAIQILVKEEVKKQLPVVVKEVVKREVSNLINERIGTSSPAPIKSKTNTKIGQGNSPKPNTVTLSKNPILNEVLSQTRPFTSNERNGTPSTPSILDKYESQITEGYSGAPEDNGFEEWPTMANPLANSTPTTPTPNINHLELANKMGYGDMATGPSTGGLGITTGLPGLDRVLNRDNRELIKAMEKTKNFRPGM